MAKKIDMTTWLGLGLLGIGVLVVFIVMSGTGTLSTVRQPAAIQQAPATPQMIAGCAIEDTTIKFDIRDRLKKDLTPDVNAQPEITRLDGAKSALSRIGNIDAGGSFTSSPGEGVLVHLIEDTVVNTASTDYYYNTVAPEGGRTPCQGTYTLPGTVAREGTMIAYVFSPSTGNAVTQAAQEAMGLGATTTFTVKLQGQTQYGFWNCPDCGKKPILVVDYNNLWVEDIIFSGINVSTAAVPEIFQLRHGAVSTAKAYYLDIGGLTSHKGQYFKEFEDIVFQVTVDSKSGQECVTDPGEIAFALFDQDGYVNQDSGAYEVDVYNTNTDTNIGATNLAWDIYCS